MQHIGGLRHLTLIRISIVLPDLAALLCACSLLESLSLFMAGAPWVSESTLRLLRTGLAGSDENAEDETQSAISKPQSAHLVSFMFVVVDSYAFTLVANESTELVLSWLEDPLHRRRLETVSLVVRTQFNEHTEIEQTMNDVRQRLKPWGTR